MKKKKGNEAINQVYATVSKVLNTADGRALLLKDAHMEQRLAYHICRDLGLICSYNESPDNNWMFGCTNPPRAKGLCTKHFQRKFIKYVLDKDSGEQ